MTRFHNPYHFVPLPESEAPCSQAVEDFVAGTIPHLPHDRYQNVADHYSGRIVCRLETVTPIFIGSQPGDGRRILPYELIPGTPALPASSLRGMISSLAEAASNSALRVLEDTPYSRRLGMREALKAIGVIVKDNTGKLKLLPLTLPSLPCDASGRITHLDRKYNAYFNIFTCRYAPLKVYVDGYRRQPGSTPPAIERAPSSFLAVSNPDSFSADNVEYWYMKLGTSALTTGKSPGLTCSHPRFKSVGGNFFLNGQLPLEDVNGQTELIDQSHYDRLQSAAKNDYTQGIIRVLGLGAGDNRSASLPMTKKHEIFIPFDPANPPGRLLEIEEALKNFQELAALRTDLDAETPYELRGSRRNSSGRGNIELRENDLVFFDLDSAGRRVGELAISSIWRRRIDSSSYEFFEQISTELLPFNPDRSIITIAEQMFGFVSESKKQEGNSALAYKSRIRLSNGILPNPSEQDCYLPEITLKILDSPKPPSPSMYFKRQNNQYISKEKLSVSKGDRPQGRKMYLHYSEAAAWETAPGRENDRPDQKSKIAPIKAGLSFYFHIDFNNLTKEELELLCYVLVPTENFMHKLGMGKPIGLGSVKVAPEGIFLLDRKKRYSSAGLTDKRYHRVWIAENSDLPDDRYPVERASIACGTATSIQELAASFSVHPDIKKAIELLGSVPSHPVHYPQVQGGDLEDKLFQWFVANDKGSGNKRNGNFLSAKTKSLAPLSENSSELPSLERYRWND